LLFHASGSRACQLIAYVYRLTGAPGLVSAPTRPALTVPLTKQCAGTVGVAATGVADVMTVLGTGSAEVGNEAVLHATTGAFALATLSVATGWPSLFVANSSNVLMPGTRPLTVPVFTPGWVSAKAEVTS